MRPIFDRTYKGKNQVKSTCELYITNWYYSYKVGIIFAMYQIMISKGTSWYGSRPIQNQISKNKVMLYIKVMMCQLPSLFVGTQKYSLLFSGTSKMRSFLHFTIYVYQFPYLKKPFEKGSIDL